MNLRPTRAVVDLDALAGNFRTLRRALPPGVAVMPVVKADGYGHGAIPVGQRLVEEGAGILAVAVVEEGVELRRGGITAPILVMGWIGPEQLEALVGNRLTPNAHSPEQLRELVEFVEAKRMELRLHLKLDTGMTRLGILRSELSDSIELLRRGKEHLLLEGVFQNFASADELGSTQTEAQAREFSEMLSAIREAGHAPSMIHTDNSAATLSGLSLPSKKVFYSVSHVRPGLALYAPVTGLPLSDSLRDVMTFLSAVDQVKRVPAGTRIGYGGTFVCARQTTVALVPAGYADGIPRSLAGTGCVLIHGRRCPIAGRVSMDMTAVDATDLPEPPRRGDEALFFGRGQGTRLGVEETAAAAGTVPWELLVGVGPRVARILVRGGRVVETQSKFL
ncbi:MAG TPA: alanine racemase [Thermoanaerobaculia bacterium]|nr:alanine racemase [Thermoanaerobaculia bacterium]